MSVVLWGARKRDVQFGSPEDMRRQPWLRMIAAIRRLGLGLVVTSAHRDHLHLSFHTSSAPARGTSHADDEAAVAPPLPGGGGHPFPSGEAA